MPSRSPHLGNTGWGQLCRGGLHGGRQRIRRTKVPSGMLFVQLTCCGKMLGRPGHMSSATPHQTRVRRKLVKHASSRPNIPTEPTAALLVGDVCTRRRGEAWGVALGRLWGQCFACVSVRPEIYARVANGAVNMMALSAGLVTSEAVARGLGRPKALTSPATPSRPQSSA